MSTGSLFDDGSIDTIVFDVVGTLVDDVGTATHAFEVVLARHGVSPDQSKSMVKRWLDGFDGATRQIAAGDAPWLPDADLRRRELSELLWREGIKLSEPESNRLARIGYHFKAWAGAPDGLAALAKKAVVVALTNASARQAAALSQFADLRWHTIVSTELAHTYKPSPAAYGLVIDLLGLQARRSLFVAAHPWDLRGAAHAGFRTCLLPRPHAGEPADDDAFDFIVGDLTDVLTLREGSATTTRSSARHR